MSEKSFKGVLRMCQGSFKVVSRKIEWFSERPLKEIQRRFKGLKGCFKEVSMLLQEFFKDVFWVFQGRLSGFPGRP